MEADRLAGITDAIDTQWDWVGYIGSRPVTVRQLADLPLHTAHRQSVGRHPAVGSSARLTG